VRTRSYNKSWTAVTVGTTIPNKALVVTGARGRLVLKRNKKASLPAEQPARSPPRLLREPVRGRLAIRSMLFDIETRGVPHSLGADAVLAAVVKGTKFEVWVDRTKASVGVDRPRRGHGFCSREQTCEPGQSVASIEERRGHAVVGVGPKHAVVDVGGESGQGRRARAVDPECDAGRLKDETGPIIPAIRQFRRQQGRNHKRQRQCRWRQMGRRLG